MSDEIQVIARMCSRADQCRRLAAALTDQRACRALLQMAAEVEADIKRLETLQTEAIVPPPPTAE